MTSVRGITLHCGVAVLDDGSLIPLRPLLDAWSGDGVILPPGTDDPPPERKPPHDTLGDRSDDETARVLRD